MYTKNSDFLVSCSFFNTNKNKVGLFARGNLILEDYKFLFDNLDA